MSSTHLTCLGPVYNQFAPLPIRPSNQLARLKYRASWYSVLPAKLLAAIY